MHSHAQGRICAFLMHSALRKLLSCKGRWEIESLRARYFSECTREGASQWPRQHRRNHQRSGRLSAPPALALVRLLLDLNQLGTSGEVESAWDEEIRARVKAFDEGRVIGIPIRNG